MLKIITTKIEEKQSKLLKLLSKASQVPVSALIRKGIDLVLQQSKEDLLTDEFRNEVDTLLMEDEELLKRLAE